MKSYSCIFVFHTEESCREMYASQMRLSFSVILYRSEANNLKSTLNILSIKFTKIKKCNSQGNITVIEVYSFYEELLTAQKNLKT